MSVAEIPSPTPSGTGLGGSHPPKYGTVVPSRIFVGGIAANTLEAELKHYFATFGSVKDAKIITDRGGISKGYGFITFDNQEDADRIIKKESENLIFKDRKLNIGPAVRKQLPRTFEGGFEGDSTARDPTLRTQPFIDGNIQPVLFTNGTPYTYQNGMAVFQQDANFGVPPPQPSYTMMMPQGQPMFVAPQYAPYQSPHAQAQAAAWPTAQASQWRWSTQGAAAQPAPMASNPGYVWATMPSPELLYPQQSPQAYTTPDVDPGFVDASCEGSVIPVEQTLATRIHSPALDVKVNEQTSVATVPVVPMQTTSKGANVVKNYTKPYAVTRRSFNTPTIMLKHGYKMQRVMVPSSTVHSGQISGQILNPGDTGDDGLIRYAQVQTISPANQ